jgi:hypothetical protein
MITTRLGSPSWGAVTGRLERQATLDRADAPQIWSVLDEGVLHRRIGDAKTMRDQLEHLADLSARAKIGVQVVPASVGAHADLTLRSEALPRAASRDLILKVAGERWT